NIETVKARLAQAGEDIEAAQQELQRVSLDAALSDDPVAAARAAVDRLAEARSRQEILSAALASAMAAETDRLNGLTEREDKARRRALAQQLAAIERHAAAVSQHQSNLVLDFKKMADASVAARALLPVKLRGPDQGLENQLTPDYMRDLADCELF